MSKKYNSDGMRLTDCCGSYSTYCDETLCCKKCFHEVTIGEGDGNEHSPAKDITKRAERERDEKEFAKAFNFWRNR